ncbi:MAG: cytochrome c [Alphaproteobacteria bacterium]|nr:cytochrome c [Alphaproteobacteria bacterium]
MRGRADRAWLGLSVALGLLLGAPKAQAEDDAVARGAYVFHAAGCLGCHTDVKNKGPALAGGRALKTPFGTFYGPNITPDPDHGIGSWSEAEFIRALREGRAPDGSHYFPAFPYPAFTGMSDQDMRDLWAYLRAQPAVAEPSRPHDLRFPFGWRFAVTFWKWLYFEPGPMAPEEAKSEAWNRGAYLVRALGHCGECHTPRDALGGLKTDMWLAGAQEGPEGGSVPNITPDSETGLGKWSKDDFLFLLQIGLTPSGDVVGGQMGEVVDNTTSKLTDQDRAAMVDYLRSLPPVQNKIEPKKTKK